MKLHLLALTLAATVFVTSPGRADFTLLEWDFFGDNSSNRPTMASTFNTSGIAASTLSRGAGAAASVGVNSFRTTGFQNDGINLANTDYFQWTLAVSTGTFSLSSINATFAGTATYVTNAPGGVTMAYSYSLDGGSSFTLMNTFQVLSQPSSFSFDLSTNSAFENLTAGDDVIFRFYASGQTTTGGWGFFNNETTFPDAGLQITGVPEPSTYVLLTLSALGLAGYAARRRQRQK
jgi:hypothetical protein